ncbi:rhodanese-like domain-containing protein [Ectothiorhodospira shaposhnikovii]|uniref:rhodanese-like domain-containing protein n=1 Tax=Ectothiorhodospira shaposhnikovii TaxID=1054 RepID=UPI001EE793F1|nr:rhodanese-like domain-containing protein [Ectothiorhodospira shaposhnikovii]MCG5511661.1 rhodanese-like domain-containing protein [Ectothiorhodospira shaposhnikovii]
MAEKDPAHLSPREAHELLRENPRALLIDIRSSMEFLFVGHPVGAVHIPWMDEPDWTLNPRFVPEVRKLLLGSVGSESAPETGAPVILICRSGKRSLDAGRLLIREGIPNVYHIGEGFEGELDEKHQRSSLGGWRFHGLPWEQC